MLVNTLSLNFWLILLLLPGMKNDDLMTKAEVLDYLKISLPTLNRLLKRTAFPYFKLDRRVLFRKRDIDAYLEAHMVKPIAKGK